MNIHEILNVKKEQVLETKFIVVDSFNDKREKISLSSGLKNFDNVLGEGFCSGKKYLIYGANKTGKTQLCHQICNQAFKLFSIDLNKKGFKFSIYIDTENTFRPERIREISKLYDLSYDSLLKSILIVKIMNNSTLLFSLNRVEEEIKKHRYRVLIIDSLNNHYRSEQGDKNISFYETRNLFIKILKKISELTKKYNLITVTTAQVAPNYLESAIIKELPVGNQFLNHFFTEYLYLNLNDENENQVYLTNSNFLPEKILPYVITKDGLKDNI